MRSPTFSTWLVWPGFQSSVPAGATSTRPSMVSNTLGGRLVAGVGAEWTAAVARKATARTRDKGIRAGRVFKRPAVVRLGTAATLHEGPGKTTGMKDKGATRHCHKALEAP